MPRRKNRQLSPQRTRACVAAGAARSSGLRPISPVLERDESLYPALVLAQQLEEMMMAVAEQVTLAEREITITRMFDAPRAVVFRAWTDAGQLAQWWGPKGFTNPVCEIDVHVGGGIRIHMRSPDGNIYRLRAEFREMGRPGRLAFPNLPSIGAGHPLF